MRAFFWLWIMFLIVCLVTDSAVYWVVGNRLRQSLDLALDAALTGGIVEADLIRGKQLAKKEIAGNWAREILQKNMAGPLTANLGFYFDIFQEKDQIWAEGQAKVKTPYLLGALAGNGSREIVVSRKQIWQGMYK